MNVFKDMPLVYMDTSEIEEIAVRKIQRVNAIVLEEYTSEDANVFDILVTFPRFEEDVDYGIYNRYPHIITSMEGDDFCPLGAEEADEDDFLNWALWDFFEEKFGKTDVMLMIKIGDE